MPEENTQPPTPQYNHKRIELEDPDLTKYRKAYDFLNRVGFEPISTGFALSCYVRLDGTGVELKTESELLQKPKLKLAIALPQGSKFLDELVAEFPETKKQLGR